ncbi:GNAT family N-acetyltransferase [Vibrio nigripulchritudo]|uniref:GNAT family N-acetyltransferase n=1 Tax=Vibrio nigripulchritudo TaxID=28173 RepID=UPI0003B192C6|nr:GNAT family N-acetyltransferase [Vibrio nigripulchritudo]BCL68181.1 N-acetyltransferase [Vibrio nigripulchritudo]BDU29509.1 N-acetyltransferase [Vibrio nigripulchritudo]CCN70190.1 putative Acyl-CoA N-acyltransferase [Vibrio nigripulchritudo SFn118]
MQIRIGTLEECVEVANAIPEFVEKETVENLRNRLDGKTHLILVAVKEEQLLGFKIGYELTEKTFYSWFGGVTPAGRKSGIAQLLMDEQEDWVAKNGYQQVKVKSRNAFPAMLRLLLRNGYLIDMYEKYPNNLDSRIHFLKDL